MRAEEEAFAQQEEVPQRDRAWFLIAECQANRFLTLADPPLDAGPHVVSLPRLVAVGRDLESGRCFSCDPLLSGKAPPELVAVVGETATQPRPQRLLTAGRRTEHRVGTIHDLIGQESLDQILLLPERAERWRPTSELPRPAFSVDPDSAPGNASIHVPDRRPECSERCLDLSPPPACRNPPEIALARSSSGEGSKDAWSTHVHPRATSRSVVYRFTSSPGHR